VRARPIKRQRVARRFMRLTMVGMNVSLAVCFRPRPCPRNAKICGAPDPRPTCRQRTLHALPPMMLHAAADDVIAGAILRVERQEEALRCVR